ncbi:hypothetical protein KUTeg_000192 [Tegillarca granosa]|uniref:Uncharacterized protein n=1 Tax=Tegillarca granosa TaxID=220873 RepID=A0ABQ9FY85_TEGGR|nr:hypothetical protein KUTeg_000192 [Tegillarca granosa]
MKGVIAEETERIIQKRQATLCGKEFDTGDGVISLPQVDNQYLPNLYCRWVIQTTPGTRVLLASDYFAVENSVQCNTVTNETSSRCNYTVTENTIMTSPGYPSNYPMNTDCFYWIQGQKGQIIEFEKISTICGTLIPPKISSTDRYLFIHFHSDYFQENRGFQVTIRVMDQTQDETTQTSSRNSKGCVEILDDKMTGLVTSPNYPLIYPNNKKCVTIIRAPLPDHFIRLNVTFLDIEGDDNCTFDFLEIYDNEDEGKVSSSGRLCGTFNNEKIYESKENICFPRCKENQVCVRHADNFECVTGSPCVNDVCENGKCIKTTTGTKCYCPPGFDGTLYEDLMIQSDSGRVQVLPGGVLDIKSFDENFEGVYKCLASTQNDFAEFTFLPPRSIASVEGSTALFSCYIPAAAEIQWFKDDVLLLPSINDRLTLLGYGYYLTIDSVTLSDAGQYKCKARSSYGCYVERSASLSVTQKEQEQGVCGRTQGNKDLTQKLTSRISGGTEYCDGNNGTKRKIQSFTIHQNFSQRAPYDNDIALIKLDSPINYTDVIKPICTKPFGLVNDMFFERRVGRKVGRVIGCGRIYENIEEAPTKLHDVYVPNVDRHLCDQADIGHRNFTDSMICAGYDRAYFGDACYGDSGGSLTMQMSRNDPWILVGLVSWGVGCDRSGHYGYYTNVAMFVDWINQQTSV